MFCWPPNHASQARGGTNQRRAQVSLPFGSSLEPSVADAERQRVAGRNGVPGGWRRLTWELHARLQWAQVKVSACLRQGSRRTNPPTPTNPRATLPSPHLGCLAWAGRWPGRSCHTCSAGCVQSRLEAATHRGNSREIKAFRLSRRCACPTTPWTCGRLESLVKTRRKVPMPCTCGL